MARRQAVVRKTNNKTAADDNDEVERWSTSGKEDRFSYQQEEISTFKSKKLTQTEKVLHSFQNVRLLFTTYTAKKNVKEYRWADS